MFALYHDKVRYTRAGIDRLWEVNDALAQLFVSRYLIIKRPEKKYVIWLFVEVLNLLGHRYVGRLLESVTAVHIDGYSGTPICLLVDRKVSAIS